MHRSGGFQADAIDRAGGIAFADFRHQGSLLLDSPQFAGVFPAGPRGGLRRSEPENPNDIKSLIDLKNLKVV